MPDDRCWSYPMKKEAGHWDPPLSRKTPYWQIPSFFFVVCTTSHGSPGSWAVCRQERGREGGGGGRGGRGGEVIMGRKVEMIKWRRDEGRGEESARDGRGWKRWRGGRWRRSIITEERK